MWRTILLALMLSAAAVRSGFGWPHSFPSGTTLYDPERAYNGYTLFSPYTNDLILINMNGKVVHQWHLPYKITCARLLPNGNVLVAACHEQAPKGRPGIKPFQMGGACGVLLELSWDGTKEVFKHFDLKMHHDALKLPNGNYLYLAWEPIPPELQARVRGGLKNTEFRNSVDAKPDLTKEEYMKLDKVMFNDVLVEVTPDKKVAWEWHANEHLDPDVDIIGPSYPREEWLHTNTINMLENGNVLLTCRLTDSMLVVDRQTKDVVFRWGCMSRLDKETGETDLVQTDYPPPTGPDKIMSGPHGGEEVPAGCPGAGHYLCYDNGFFSTGPLRISRGVEVDPKTGEVAWQSQKMKNGAAFTVGPKHFSEIFGTAQRLPNGNTLLCEGTGGRIFQIAPDLSEVWEYVSMFSDAEDKRINGMVVKAHCYAPDYCPQFKEFLPAKGVAVHWTPNAGEKDAGAGSAVAGSGKEDATGRSTAAEAKRTWEDAGLPALAIVAAVAVAAAFVYGRKRGRRDAVAGTP